MTSFTNAVVVGLLLFLGLLAAVWYAVEVRAQEGVEVTSRSAEWIEGSQGQTLELRLLVENPRRTEAELQGVTYSVSYGNATSASVSKPLSVLVPPGKVLNVTFPVPLPDFPADWWTSYLEAGEEGAIAIDGHLTVLQSVRRQEVGFRWESTWRGGLAEGLSSALESCPSDDDPVCLVGSQAQWDQGDLHLVLTVRNQETFAVTLTKVEAALAFGPTPVASGGGDGALRIPAGTTRDLALEVDFIPANLTSWWPGHVAACERSPSSLDLAFTLDGGPSGGNNTTTEAPQTLEWMFDGPDVRTLIACRPSP